jgi:hypothetical protein
MTEAMLTTKDNPFDPFDEFDKWNRYDQMNGYNTISLISRLCRTSDDDSPSQIAQEWEEAIDEIMKHVDFGIYEKVTR